MAVDEYLRFVGRIKGIAGNDIRRRTGEVVERCALGEAGNKLISKLSRGFRQRVGLAQALIHNPDVLILDEPTDGVDPVGRTEMRGVLQRLKDEGKTIFINSHLLQEVELVCDRVGILVSGELRREGLIDEITHREEAEVELKVTGPEQKIRSALAPRVITEWTVVSADEFQVSVKLSDQSAVDQCIDALRRDGVSILSLSRRRDTLEEAFLGIVSQGAPAPIVLGPLPPAR
jgi:ABC-2 type transport system ATP-binding protein